MMWRLQRRFSLAARHRFFGQAPKKWGRIAGQANDNLPTYRRTRTRPRQAPAPPQVGRGTSRLPTGSAHANGGAAVVKKALFFGGSTPFLWASTKEMGSKGRTSHRPPPNVSAHTYKRKERRGKPLDRVSPLNSLPDLMRAKRGFRALRSAARGFASGLHRL